jgi:hypothetical protein
VLLKLVVNQNHGEIMLRLLLKLPLIKLILPMVVLSLPFWLTGTNGQPHLIATQALQLDSYAYSMQKLLGFGGNSTLSKTKVTRWQDEEGNWHYGDQQAASLAKVQNQSASKSMEEFEASQRGSSNFIDLNGGNGSGSGMSSPLLGYAIMLVCSLWLVWGLISFLKSPFAKKKGLERDGSAPDLDVPIEFMVTTDYDVLGIKKGASQIEIQQAYEAKMAAFDEAKIAAMGKSMQRDIAAKKQKIRLAYDNLSAAS